MPRLPYLRLLLLLGTLALAQPLETEVTASGDTQLPPSTTAPASPSSPPSPPPAARCRVADGSYDQLVAISKVLDSMGMFDEAEACLIDAINQTKESFKSLSSFATRRGEFARAADIASMALSVDNSADTRLFHATSLLKAGLFQQALVRLEPIVDANPAAPEVHHLIGVALYRTGNGAAAVASLEKAVELDPAQKQYTFDLAEVRGAMQQQQGAGQQVGAAGANVGAAVDAGVGVAGTVP